MEESRGSLELFCPHRSAPFFSTDRVPPINPDGPTFVLVIALAVNLTAVEVLRSIVKQEFKMHMPAPGVPGAAAPVFNILRDPRESSPDIGQSLWSGASFQDMAKRHAKMIAKYPHRPIGKDEPYGGIENLRPESELARKTFASWQDE